jgi:hypothetical protein
MNDDAIYTGRDDLIVLVCSLPQNISDSGKLSIGFYYPAHDIYNFHAVYS